MDDLIKSFKAQMYDRVTSPLLSSFLISWAAWNHRLFFALMSDLKLAEKFKYIDDFLYPTWFEVLGRGLFFPLGVALLLIYAYPIPARKVYQYVMAEQKKLRSIQRQIEDETPISEEKARELRAVLRDAEEISDRKLSERDELIKDLKAELAEVRERGQRERVSETGEQEELALKPKLSDFEVTVLNLIASDDRFAYKADLLTTSKAQPIDLEYALDQLVEADLIDQLNEARGSAYALTPRGRAFYIHFVRPVLGPARDSGASNMTTTPYDEQTLDDEQAHLLAVIANSNGMSEANIHKALGGGSIRGRYNIDELQRRKFIVFHAVGASGIYRATPAGRSYLMKIADPSLFSATSDEP